MISKDSARGMLLVAVLAMAMPARPAGQQGLDSRAAFERLKGLAGTWDVTERDNPATKEIATYALTGRGSVVVEHLQSPTGAMGHMMTTYHLDNGRLVLTHFCGAGNQPRMRVTAIDDGGKRIAFEMYDITNLAGPQAFHSTRVDVVFLNDNRVDLVYKGKTGDHESTQVFQLARKTGASGEAFYQRPRALEGEWDGTFHVGAADFDKKNIEDVTLKRTWMPGSASSYLPKN